MFVIYNIAQNDIEDNMLKMVKETEESEESEETEEMMSDNNLT
jgi:hypothetical protein|tara:strand:+ start:2054 stop:2182 length:129 start_codon:yes stop_codon:yes gene_type:complete